MPRAHQRGEDLDRGAGDLGTGATAGGVDGYPVLGDQVTAYGGSLAIAGERYLLAESPVNPQIEGRIVQVPAP